MKTILHIGMPKTGSTALQNCLQASRGRLAARGALYPANPPDCPFNNHRLLVLGFLRFADLPRHIRRHAGYTATNLGAKYADFLAHLRRETAEARPAAAILSSETLFRRLDPAAQRSLRAALDGLGGGSAAETVVAVYLRRPSDYYLSALQQRLKNAHTVTPPRVKSSCGVLASYAAVFGEAAIRPRVFDRRLLAEGDIVADFLAAHLPELGLDPAALKRRSEANATISGEAMAVMRRFRFDFHRDREDVASPDGSSLLRTLRRVDRAIGAARPRLRPEIAEAIDYARDDPLRLRDAYGLEFPDLDYRRLARRGRLAARGAWPLIRGALRPWRLEEVVALDPAVQRALLDELARSPWAQAAPARAAWIADRRREAA